MEFLSDETQIRERIRDAIQTNGGASFVAKKTGIPIGTLNKYVAMSSTASFTNAAKIAAVIGVSLEEIAFGRRVDDQQAPYAVNENSEFDLILELGQIVKRAYKSAGITLSGATEVVEINVLHKELLNVVRDINQTTIVQAVLPELEKRLQFRLSQAKLEPGTGKREAS
ncbi:helix-turn-helix transcriptional regulator [Ochrobactrum sp. MR28]|nr:helix-turn-helix transcriptional regulator [Ochrobactrum sp. MR28]MBX8814778.1 helix-turn-helix transcriptional regulator [Ochrobactrum sp. MR31]